MPRYSTIIKTDKSEKECESVISGFMEQEGFKRVNYQGEDVWKKGMGLLTAPQFMKTEIQKGKVELQAWIKFALLPGLYVGEMGITGFTAFAIKKVLRGRVQRLEAKISE